MEKEYETFDEVLKDYINGKISYNEYVKQLCISYVGKDNFDFYDLIDHDLYIYCLNDEVVVISNFY